MNWEAFFTVHRDLPREGPGAPQDVHWVLDRIPPPARVLDAACGPGADTVTLAERLPNAQITAVEQVPHFVQAARARCQQFGPHVCVEEGDMFAQTGPFDLIWCAGAVYFKGVTDALSTWCPALAPGGYIAFSEPLAPGPDAPAAAHAFWAEYPQFASLPQIEDQVRAAGFEPRATRRIVGAPWEAYYDPLQTRIEMLRRQSPDADLMASLDENQREIDLWRAARDHVAYVLILATPNA